jgi:hypothetical protein
MLPPSRCPHLFSFHLYTLKLQPPKPTASNFSSTLSLSQHQPFIIPLQPPPPPPSLLSSDLHSSFSPPALKRALLKEEGRREEGEGEGVEGRGEIGSLKKKKKEGDDKNLNKFWSLCITGNL